MNFTVNRTSFSSEGVFGVLIGDNGDTYYTLEHAYQQPDNSYAPKVATGIYTCVRHAPNRLPYATFEVTGVPDFMGQPVTGILLHIGNYNKDSEGCFLLGLAQSQNMVTNSEEAFNKFMTSLEGTDSFELTVK